MFKIETFPYNKDYKSLLLNYISSAFNRKVFSVQFTLKFETGVFEIIITDLLISYQNLINRWVPEDNDKLRRFLEFSASIYSINDMNISSICDFSSLEDYLKYLEDVVFVPPALFNICLKAYAEFVNVKSFILKEIADKNFF